MKRMALRRSVAVGLLCLALAFVAVPKVYAVSPAEGDFVATVANAWSDFVNWLVGAVGLPVDDDDDDAGAPPPGSTQSTTSGGDQGPSLDPTG
jgi:hypothetical protein